MRTFPIYVPDQSIKAHQVMGMGKTEFDALAREARESITKPARAMLFHQIRHASFHRKPTLNKATQRLFKEIGVMRVLSGGTVLGVSIIAGLPVSGFIGFVFAGMGAQKLVSSQLRSEKRYERVHKKIMERVHKQEEKLREASRQGLEHYAELTLAQSLPKLFSILDGKHSARKEVKAVQKFLNSLNGITESAVSESPLKLDTSIDVLVRLQDIQKQILARLREARTTDQKDQRIFGLLSDNFASTSRELNKLQNVKSGVTKIDVTLPTYEQFLADAGIFDSPFIMPGEPKSVEITSDGKSITIVSHYGGSDEEIDPMFESYLETDHYDDLEEDLEIADGHKLRESRPSAPNTPTSGNRRSGEPRDPDSTFRASEISEPPGGQPLHRSLRRDDF